MWKKLNIEAVFIVCTAPSRQLLKETVLGIGLQTEFSNR